MKYGLCFFLIVPFFIGCGLPAKNNAPTHYIIKYYYETGGMTMMNYIFIDAFDDSTAYIMACDTFLNRTKVFVDTVKSKNRYNIVPSTFSLEKIPNEVPAISKSGMDSIYTFINKKNIYKTIDTTVLNKYLNIEAEVEKPPVVIVKSWVSHNSINDPEANITIKNNSKKNGRYKGGDILL